MATIKRGGNFIEITSIAADVSPQDIFGTDDNFPEGKKVKRIEFVAGANNDICVIRQDDRDDPIITTLASPDVEMVDRTYFDDDGQYMWPYIDFSESTLTAGHKVIFELD